MGFISKFLLPKEVDFDAGLQAQATITRNIVMTLCHAIGELSGATLAEIRNSRNHARELKNKNLKELLDVFITRYDKESIYRIITQLDWVTLSVKHLVAEIEAYELSSLQQYAEIFVILEKMSDLLNHGVKELSTQELKTIDADIEQIHDLYDEVVEGCAREKVKLMQENDWKYILMQKDILMQLKEIARRIHVTANTLEDMAIKIV